MAFDLSGGSVDKQTIICSSLMDREELLDMVEEQLNKDKPPLTPSTPLTPSQPVPPALLPQSPTVAGGQGKSDVSRRCHS